VRLNVIITLVAICFAVPSWGAGGTMAAAPPQPVVIQLKWVHQFQFAGYYVALERGFYREEGLDVHLREGEAEIDTARSVVDGQADFAVASPGVLIDRHNGWPLVAVAAIFQHSPAVLMVLRSSGIDSPQALAGRRIMMGGRFTDTEPLAMLIAEGVNRVPPVMVPHDRDLSALIDGRVDALSSYLTNEPFLLQQAGYPVTVLRPRQYGIDFYGDVLITSEKIASSRPEMVEAVLRATQRGWAYAMAHPEEAADLILERYSQRKSREQLLFEARAMQELILPDLIEIGHMNPGRWRHIGETYVSVGLLPADWSLDGFLFSQIRETERQRFERAGEWAGVAALVALGIALLLALFVAQLRGAVRRRTRELTASEQQFRTIFDSVTDAILILPRDGGPILAANQRTVELFGHPLARLQTLGFADLGEGAPPFGPAEAQAWQEQAAAGAPQVFEWRARAGDGRLFWLEISLKPARIAEVDRLLLVARDISARKQGEETLRQTIDALVASNTDLERFSYISSHDLQTPLRNVVSYAQLLARRYRGRLDGDADEFIGFIIDNTRHMSDLINDLIDYTQVGGPARSLAPVSAGRAVGLALQTLRSDIDDTNALIRVGEMPMVLAEDSHLVSLFLNLIGNALLYRTPGRWPEIIVAAESMPDGRWKFSVRDNGIGIEAAYHAKIFEIFQRLHPDHGSRGTGIGLALCQRIVRRFGGEIWVESTPGTGSTFFFTLAGRPD
jgi:PAS domain S-box-containing protein